MTNQDAVNATFTLDTQHHELTVLHEDGLYRHYWLSNPKRVHGEYWFEVVTTPNMVVINGDMGSYTFVRPRSGDLLSMFKGHSENYSYWAEKCSVPTHHLMEFEADTAKKILLFLTENFDEEEQEEKKAHALELWKQRGITDEESYLDLLEELGLDDDYDPEWCRDFHYHFIWNCLALRLTANLLAERDNA